MKINHVAYWVKDLEKMKNFFLKYFNVESNEIYRNKSGFSSYFLTFKDGGRIELMKKDDGYRSASYDHLAISVGSKDKVDSYTEIFKVDGYKIVGEPRTTGDGYYESVILDPEGNKIEITI
jgi:lactoylglutathione lyase